MGNNLKNLDKIGRILKILIQTCQDRDRMASDTEDISLNRDAWASSPQINNKPEIKTVIGNTVMKMGQKRGIGDIMARKGKEDQDKEEEDVDSEIDASTGYAMGFLTLKNAIIENCKDCIRDCGRDCLDRSARPLENIRCPLQKVRMDFEIAINYEIRELRRSRLMEQGDWI
jgi:hypothetical protein